MTDITDTPVLPPPPIVDTEPAAPVVDKSRRVSAQFTAGVAKLFPNASFLKDVVVRDDNDGLGPYLVSWNLAAPVPTATDITAALAAPAIPQVVTNLQARLALRQAGLIDNVKTAVAAATPDVQDMWEYSATISRTNPQLLALAKSLNLTDTALDHLFVIAASF